MQLQANFNSIDDSKSKALLVHPTGNANSRAVLEGMCNHEILGEFHTAVASYPGNIWSILSKTPLGRDFARRQFSLKAKSLTRQRPAKEILRLLSNKLGFGFATKHEVGPLSVDAVYRDVGRAAARKMRRINFGCVYAYEDGALDTFETAKELGLQCYYDLPIGYWRAARQFLDVERERWPEWASTMPGLKDSPEKLERKDKELKMADAIFVASSFTAKTLEEYPESGLAPVHVIPYGFPSPVGQRNYDELHSRKLRLLFVGGLSQRKGIADVFAAADHHHSDVELTVIGRGQVDDCPPLKAALGRHRWIPSMPHDQVLKEMRSHDVLLFPSLFEGFGLVITEAMSQGTPVITTDRTAGPDVFDDGKSGWLVPPGDTDALIQKIGELLSDRDQIANVGFEAMKMASTRSWKDYGDELACKVASLMESKVHNRQ